MSQEITYGSIGYMEQQGQPIAESFLSVDAILMLDISASMQAEDTPNGQSRYTVACDEMRRLQRETPGKLALIEWATGHAFIPGGVPSPPEGYSTNMAGVLRFAKRADGCAIKFILISDGEPDSEDETLDVARQFTDHIHTIYIGPEGGRGAAFLRRLADATGGRAETKSAREIVTLAKSVTKLLTT